MISGGWRVYLVTIELIVHLMFLQRWQENIYIMTYGMWAIDPMAAISYNTSPNKTMFSIDTPSTSAKDRRQFWEELDVVAYSLPRTLNTLAEVLQVIQLGRELAGLEGAAFLTFKAEKTWKCSYWGYLCA
jgi:hypothetical protein